MKKLLLTATFSAFLLSLFVPTTSYAQENSMMEEEAATEEAQVVEEVDSFELFWPVVAGRTMDDSLYFLKTLKEKVRGWFIFGAPQKAEYSAFLATKRMVEAEKLINEGKSDLANQTLDRAISQLENVEEDVDKVVSEGGDFQDVGIELTKKLENIEVFTKWLIREDMGDSEKLSRVLELTAASLSDLR